MRFPALLAALATPSIRLAPTVIALALAPQAPALLEAYTQVLSAAPLETKTATAAALGFVGDAIAQRSSAPPGASVAAFDRPWALLRLYDRPKRADAEWLDARRSLGHTAFCAAYTGAFQHALFPWIGEVCKGGAFSALLHGGGNLALLAAAERTLLNQLVFIPLLYYPSFFLITGAARGLSFNASARNLRRDLAPLLSRNLQFWLPIQFVQFAFLPVQWQVPYICLAGLVWNVILSASAGGSR